MTSKPPSVLDGDFCGNISLKEPDAVARFDGGVYEKPIHYSFFFADKPVPNMVPSGVVVMEPDIVDYLINKHVWVIDVAKVRRTLESGQKLPWAKFVGEK